MEKIIHIMDDDEYEEVCKTEDPVAVLKYLCDKEEYGETKTIRVACWRARWLEDKIRKHTQRDLTEDEWRTMRSYTAGLGRSSFATNPDDVEEFLSYDWYSTAGVLDKLMAADGRSGMDKIYVCGREVKPCPFCGGGNIKPVIIDDWTYIGCGDCGVIGMGERLFEPFQLKVTDNTNAIFARLVDRWNTRAYETK